MGRDGEPIMGLGITMVMLASAVICMGVIYSCHEDQCQAACLSRYGEGWEARVTHTEVDHVCDCIGPDGTVKGVP